MTLKVGLIGVGGIARVHMPGWAASEHAEVIAGCDIHEGALQKWGKEHGVERLYATPGDIINDPDIDIIDIITPNAYHAPMTIAALEAGKHVICEKPLAPTPDEIRQMIAARDAAGKLLMTAQHQRWRGVSKALKAEIDAGVLGQIYHARSRVLRRAFVPGRNTFVIKSESGGGVTIDMGVHILDLTLWMMGHPKAVSVTGITRTELANRPGAFSVWGDGTIPPEMDVEELALAFIRFDNGATLVLEASWMLHHNTEIEDMQMWLYGTEGGAHWPNNIITKTNYETQQLYNIDLQLKKEINPPHAQECMDFAEAIVTGAPSPVPPEESLQVAEILHAIYRSSETGAEVRLDA